MSSLRFGLLTPASMRQTARGIGRSNDHVDSRRVPSEDTVVGGEVAVEIVHPSDGCGPVVPAGSSWNDVERQGADGARGGNREGRRS
jgi:hypothetical protein